MKSLQMLKRSENILFIFFPPLIIFIFRCMMNGGGVKSDLDQVYFRLIMFKNYSDTNRIYLQLLLILNKRKMRPYILSEYILNFSFLCVFVLCNVRLTFSFFFFFILFNKYTAVLFLHHLS